MVRLTYLLLLTFAIALGGCARGGATPMQSDSPNLATGDAQSATGSLASPDQGKTTAASRSPEQSSSGVVAPPPDAQWTLYCGVVSGNNHVERANRLKSDLIASSKMKDWYLVHGEGTSTLYYGYYRSISDDGDPGERGRAQNDRRRISELKNTSGELLFRSAVFVKIDSPDPDAPAEWDLAKTPRDAFWTVQVAAYKDSPDRKRTAVESVRDARNMGIDAYFYHGPIVSSVCVGLWPREAVREQESDSVSSVNPQQPVVLLPGALPKDWGDDVMLADGSRARVLVPVVEPVDPSMIATLQKYPNHALNGQEFSRIVRDPKTNQTRTIFEKSFVVQIPRGEDDTGGVVAPQADPSLLPAQPSATPDSGLRRVGG